MRFKPLVPILLITGWIISASLGSSPQSIGPTKGEKEELARIADRVDEVLRTKDTLTFEAHLIRTYTDSQYHYKAVVDMRVGEVNSVVFDAADPDRKIATLKGTISPGKEPQTTQENHVKDVDGCSFGTLSYPWIGPPETSYPPSFVKRIRNGRLTGTEPVAGRPCYKITNSRAADVRDDEYDRIIHRKIKHVTYVGTESFRVLRWDTVKEDTPESKKAPNYTATRVYHYADLAVCGEERASLDTLVKSEGEPK